MTTTSDRTAPPVAPPDLVPPIADQPDDDRRPGTSDIGWAERAYRHQPAGPACRPGRAGRARHLRPRTLIGAPVVVLLAAGLALAMADQGSPPAPAVHQPAPHRVTGRSPTSRQSQLTRTPPLLRLPTQKR